MQNLYSDHLMTEGTSHEQEQNNEGKSDRKRDQNVHPAVVIDYDELIALRSHVELNRERLLDNESGVESQSNVG